MPLVTQVKGEGLSLKAGEALAQDELVAVHSDGKAYKANAKTGADQQIPAIGIAEETVLIGEEVAVKALGDVEGADTGISGLTVGATVYLAETDGDFTTTAPSTSGDVVQAVGKALSATRVFLSIDSSYTTVP